ncbi:hypothetical protein MARINON1_50895 [Marinobacter salarius]|nr:hypothetical protein MBHK15_130716 [Marinobacter salarius]VXB62651.1 hypothetical protein MARINON1_50895 [Marinobacter salarius]
MKGRYRPTLQVCSCLLKKCLAERSQCAYRLHLFASAQSSGWPLGVGVQNRAEPWMAELERHMDVPKERVLDTHSQRAPPSKQ